MTLDELLDELNDADVSGELRALKDAVDDMESCETSSDFACNLDTAIQSAGMILLELKKIKKATTKRSNEDE